MTTSSTPDLIILGSGSTAFAGALRATSHGARVLMFEKSVLGGTCINWGCIPSKTLIHAALFNHEAHLGMRLGLGLEDGRQGVACEALFAHREKVVHKLRQERYLDVLKNMSGLELVKGTARFIDPHTIEANDKRYRCDRFLVAVGGKPRIPPIPGIEVCNYLTSRSALLMKELPQSLVIVGGGVIAVELGQMYHRLGCRVTILEHGPHLLPTVEREAAEALRAVLMGEGIKVVTDVTICSADRAGDVNVLSADVCGRRHEYTAQRLLLAVGTGPATEGLGLEQANVGTDPKGFIVTDGRMRTSTDGIWAAGDVTGKMLIATVGARQAIVAVDDMFNEGCGCTMDYLSAPMAVFTDPEIGMVGHTEESARQAGFDVAVNTMPVSAIPKAHVTGHTAGVIKMIADRPTGRLLGVHLACHRGADMINEAALALHLKATVADLATTMHVYPSIGEGLKLCAQGFDRDISRLSCCAE
ncbi:mercury(II) reductase [Oryzomonas rubra]|uniref:Mercuric reductase n=1 Tax=Oryzomonas rubra TaxID=2509454 RepID=A0A5A9X767_9BACT|nr:mercury(II) reductase [Oryzomonas rubra]KAA0888278.1 mercury(II) reductase [Oryzomonas rubra]